MVTGPTNVDIVAHKYGNISAVLDIDDASHVTVYKGYSYYGTSVEVKPERTLSRCQNQHLS